MLAKQTSQLLNYKKWREGVINIDFTLTSDQVPSQFAIFSDVQEPHGVFSPLRNTLLIKIELQYPSG